MLRSLLSGFLSYPSRPNSNSSTGGNAKARRKPQSHKKSRALRLESLEIRELMAGDSSGPIDDYLPRGSVNGLHDNHFVVAGDFDKNGLADVLYINKQSGQNRAVLNQGNGQFVNRDDFFPRGSINGLYDNHFVLAGDFDSNGLADVLYFHKQSGQNRLVLNLGNGQFTNRDNLVPAGLINGLYDNHVVVAGDFDRNGLADVLYINKQSGQNRLALNLGNGQFTNRDDFVPRGSINGLYDNHIALAGDFDRNGFADVLYIHKETGQNRFIFNYGNGQFAAPDNVLPTGYVNQLYAKHYVVAGDFDRDGDAELIYINKETGGNRLLGLTPRHGIEVASDGGVLTITGTDLPDKITIAPTSAGVIVVADATYDYFASGTINQIVVDARGGDDVVQNLTTLPSILRGGDGKDTLIGGAAADWLYGGAGDDILKGNNGSDVLFGNAGNDELHGGLGSDSTIQEDYVSYDAATGTVIVTGTSVGDTLQVGDLGLDLVVRVGGNEVAFLAHDGLMPKRLDMHGLGGNDTIRNDTYLPSTIYGDAGIDTLFGSDNPNVDDRLYGGSEDDTLYGRSGNDIIEGGSGSDWLYGQQGNDTFVFGEALQAYEVDRVLELPGADAEGTDFLDFSSMTSAVNANLAQSGKFASSTNRDIYGDGGCFEQVRGGTGSDQITGSPGSEILDGGPGNDVIIGGGGNDRLLGGAGIDLLGVSESSLQFASVFLTVPLGMPQLDNSSCGPNNANRVLQYYGAEVTYEQMMDDKVDSPDSWLIDKFGLGTKATTLESLMRRNGLASAMAETDVSFERIIQRLNEGRPVIALVNQGGFNFHYITINGYDPVSGTVHYVDTDGQQCHETRSEFESEWNWDVGWLGNQLCYAAGLHPGTIVS